MNANYLAGQYLILDNPLYCVTAKISKLITDKMTLNFNLMMV
ncbi:hypothetical protein A1OE_175 [Candidatus Endolissoclinum faulkneri L2]|uniref:Uncharacterized protein n=1 Tax=Candidatus Endolissoclinum faulkneri L2 TaxID=1193729 RepID=K7Z339_9PROT|nr:hypothetical protein A1OE_175 [Candidatus Endolissoclinum faulkneri L2]